MATPPPIDPKEGEAVRLMVEARERQRERRERAAARREEHRSGLPDQAPWLVGAGIAVLLAALSFVGIRQSVAPQIRVDRVRVEPWVTPQRDVGGLKLEKRNLHMAYLDWTVTGTVPVCSVTADIDAPAQAFKFPDRFMFVTRTREDCIEPGQSYVTPRGQGTVILDIAGAGAPVDDVSIKVRSVKSTEDIGLD